MSFDESLFILPNEGSGSTQSGGNEPFTFILYEGSDSLKNYIKLDKPYILIKKPSVVSMIDAFSMESTGLTEDDIIAVNADAFLKILETPSLGGGLEKHLYFTNDAITQDIKHILGEQVLFLAMFHQLHFLASVNKLGVPYLATPVNERFEAIRTMLNKEQLTQSIFNVPFKEMETYYSSIQTEYVGTDVRRVKSLNFILELITKEPADIIAYFSEGVQYMTDVIPANAASVITTSTRRGFNNISLSSRNFNNDSVKEEPAKNGLIPTSVVSEPVVEESKVEESKVEESKVEESKVEEPVVNTQSVITSGTDEPTSVAESIQVDLQATPVNARLESVKSQNGKVAPPTLPLVINKTRKNKNKTTKQKTGQSAFPRTRRVTRAEFEAKKSAKTQSVNTNNEIDGYNTSRAVVLETTNDEAISRKEPVSKKVRVNPSTTYINSEGFEELVPIKRGK